MALTGDHHHYARFECRDERYDRAYYGEQKIIAGGGGAYLSATHHLPDRLTLPPPASRSTKRTDERDYHLGSLNGPEACYPTKERSRQLGLGAPSLLWRNGLGFPVLVGVLYAIWAFTLVWPGDPTRGLGETIVRVVVPFAAPFMILVTFVITRLFTHEKRKVRASLLAALHTLLHVIAVVILVFWVSSASFYGRWFETNLTSWWRWAVVVTVGMLGGALGCLVVGVYLVIADFFDVNTNEQFAAQHFEDSKCFLRLHLQPDGDLTIYPIKVERVARRWKGFEPGEPPEVPWFEPEVEPVAELIEPPITVTRQP